MRDQCVKGNVEALYDGRDGEPRCIVVWSNGGGRQMLGVPDGLVLELGARVRLSPSGKLERDR